MEREFEWPVHVDGYGPIRRHAGQDALAAVVQRAAVKLRRSTGQSSKCLPDIAAALSACEVRDGATLSFHHHLRNGDQVLNQVLDACAKLGLENLTVAASSLFRFTRRWLRTCDLAWSRASSPRTCPGRLPTPSAKALWTFPS